MPTLMLKFYYSSGRSYTAHGGVQTAVNAFQQYLAFTGQHIYTEDAIVYTSCIVDERINDYVDLHCLILGTCQEDIKGLQRCIHTLDTLSNAPANYNQLELGAREYTHDELIRAALRQLDTLGLNISEYGQGVYCVVVEDGQLDRIELVAKLIT